MRVERMHGLSWFLSFPQSDGAGIPVWAGRNSVNGTFVNGEARSQNRYLTVRGFAYYLQLSGDAAPIYVLMHAICENALAGPISEICRVCPAAATRCVSSPFFPRRFCGPWA